MASPSKKNRPAAPKNTAPNGATPATTPSTAVRGDLWRLPLAAIGLLLVVWMGYWNATDNTWVSWDDQEYVTERPEVLDPSPANVSKLWHRPVSLNYHPLTMTTLAWNSRSAEKDPELLKTNPATNIPSAEPFIRTNVWLHAFNTVFVLLLVWMLTQGNWGVSLFTALLFGIHPMHVESVAWVSERKDVLYSFFFLGGLIAYVRYVDKKFVPWLLLAFALFVLSCLSKAMAVVLPAVLLLVDIWRGRSLADWKVWVEKIPFFAVSLFFGLMALSVQGGGDFNGMLEVNRALGTSKAIADPEVFSLLQRLQFGAYGYMMYVWKFFVPAGLCTFYPYPTQAELAGGFGALLWLAVLFFFGTLGWAVYAWIKKDRLWPFSVGFYFFTAVLVLQFLAVGKVIMADRYTYLPYIGLCFLVLEGAHRWVAHSRNGRIALWTGAGLFSLFCLWGTVKQVDVWQNSRTLWERVIALHPSAPDAYNYLGSWYGKSGNLEMAKKVFDQGIRAGAQSSDIFEGMGNYYGTKGRPDSAVYFFNLAVKLQPEKGKYYYNRGTAYSMLNPDSSIADFTRAIQLGVETAGEAHARRAQGYLAKNDYAAALKDLDFAINQYNVRLPYVYQNRAICHYYLNNYPAAKADAQQALKANPNLPQAQQILNLIGN
jgi:tetratricopeptide (TPR) repeat protein